MRLAKAQAIPECFPNVFRSFLAGRVSHNVRVYCVHLDLGYLVACSVKNATVRKCCDQAEGRRDSVRGVLCGSGLGRAVVFAGELEEFGFDRFHSGLLSPAISP